MVTDNSLGQGSQQLTHAIDPMLGQCYSAVYDAGPILNQHWINVSSCDYYILLKAKTLYPTLGILPRQARPEV